MLEVNDRSRGAGLVHAPVGMTSSLITKRESGGERRGGVEREGSYLVFHAQSARPVVSGRGEDGKKRGE